MKLNDIYPLLSSHKITLFAIEENKVYTIYPEATKTETLSKLGDYEVLRLIPLEFQHLQITIKKR